MRFLGLIILIMPTISFADTAIKKTMDDYLNAIKSKNARQLKRVTTKNYFQTLEKQVGIKNLFSMQRANNEKLRYDIKIVPSKNPKVFHVNIKNPHERVYDRNWFKVIKKSNSQVKIDGTFFMDKLD